MNHIIEVASLAACWSSDGHLQEAKHWTLLAGLVAVGLPQRFEAHEQCTLCTPNTEVGGLAVPHSADSQEPSAALVCDGFPDLASWRGNAAEASYINLLRKLHGLGRLGEACVQLELVDTLLPQLILLHAMLELRGEFLSQGHWHG